MPSPITTRTAATIRSWTRRFDRYTLEVLNPGALHRLRPDRA
jgi:hypothetical protein